MIIYLLNHSYNRHFLALMGQDTGLSPMTVFISYKFHTSGSYTVSTCNSMPDALDPLPIRYVDVLILLPTYEARREYLKSIGNYTK